MTDSTSSTTDDTQLTRDDLATLTPQEIVAAQNAGRLRDVIAGHAPGGSPCPTCGHSSGSSE